VDVFKKFALIDKRLNSNKNRSESHQTVKKFEETPLEKFQRINSELQEFKEELEFSQEKVQIIDKLSIFI